MRGRLAIAACLVFSGACALVYQIIWVRLLGFSFGTTTAAVSSVLAVFFAGLALGNLLAATRLARLRRPLRIYALLELAIGLYALASLPLLQRLDLVYLVVGTQQGALALTAVRLGVAALVLLPPTLAMGATLPLVARGLVSEDASLGRWSAILYAANTLGAVAGAYLCGFWLIPWQGLAHSVYLAAAANLAVAAIILAFAGQRGAGAPAPEQPAPARPDGRAERRRAVFLALFGLSGFVAIGYEIVWSKVFGIVMEGTLYGFAAVLSAFLLGIGLGSLAIAARVDRIRDLPRAFGLLHVAIAIAVLLGASAVPDLPWWFSRVAPLGGGDAIHVLYLLVLPIVLVPTALFGAAFPVLIRIYTERASETGRGIGIATAVNTAGSIAASLLVGFWWIPSIGMDRSLAILLGLDAALGLFVLAVWQRARGWRRAGVWLASAAALAVAALAFEGVQVDRAIAGRFVTASSLAEYRERLDRELASQIFRAEGTTSVVTVHAQPGSRLLRTNGLPEAGILHAPPYYPSESMDLGVLPYLFAGAPQRALLVGLGGGNTLQALLDTQLAQIDVVELEREVVAAQGPFAQGRARSLADPRVRLLLNDGRNELLIAGYEGRPAYDVIASQPSHPWRVGAASLFTEEYFLLARSLLSETGCFSVWVNGFHMDAESLLAILASFERVFPGSLLFDISDELDRGAFLLLGARRPLAIDVAALRLRMQEPRLARLLARFGVDSLEEVLARIEGPAAVFAALEPAAANTDDGAFVETRLPRRVEWASIDYASLEARLPADAPVLPRVSGLLDLPALVAFLQGSGGRWRFGPRVERLLSVHGQGLDPVVRETLFAQARARDPRRERHALRALVKLAEAHPQRAEPLRALGDRQLATGNARRAAEAYEAAFARTRAPRDAVSAGRARFEVGERDAAFAWFERVPASERERHPELAFYAAWHALERGAQREALRGAFERLATFRASPAGQDFPGSDELLAQLAYALGDLSAARGYSDLAEQRRREQAGAALARAGRHLRAGRLEKAAEEFAEAARLRPADPAVLRFRVQLALARKDRAAVDAGLRELRRWSRTRLEAILAENRLREEQGLPLLSEQAALEIWNGSRAAPAP